MAVIGTGASAVQFVPEIAPLVARLSIFQRTGNWFLPRKNRRYPRAVKAAFERVPRLQAMRRRFVFQYSESLTLAIRHPRTRRPAGAARSAAFMRSQLKDPELRRKAWPDYTFGCKRILFSSDFLPALQRANVELVTEPIERDRRPSGVGPPTGASTRSTASSGRPASRPTTSCSRWRSPARGGRALREAWAGGAHAHLGIAVPGFPNMFVMYGPNTNTSGGSIIFYLETQAAYIRQALEQLRDRGRRRDRGARRRRGGQRPRAAGALRRHRVDACDSWYRDERGRIVANWPGYMREYFEQARSSTPSEYRFLPLPEPRAARARLTARRSACTTT